MKELYQRIADNRSESEVQLRLSYLEIYNEMIRDLLSETPTPPGQGLPLREDEASKMSVVGISEHSPASPEDVLLMIQEGNQRRTMSPTEANAVSSRSHAVLQINVTQRPKTGDVRDATTSASLNIIDLAGSERASATSNNGARMKEGANINKSLLALGNCINALCQTGVKQQHIPYRNSKLTRLLKFSLGGNCKTVMIVCVSPSSGHYEETHNTLKYANQAKNIRTKVSQNVVNVDRHVATYVRTIHELKEEVAQLKAQLAEGGPAETESEKRKKREARVEMETVLAELRTKVQAAKMSISRESRHEAVVQAAEHSSSLYKQRLDEINGLLRDWRRGKDAAAEEEEPLDWTSERTFLQSLMRKDEILLQASRDGARNLSSSIDLLMGLLNRAPRNSRFDAESSERVKLVADSLKAEVEAEREKARALAALESYQTQAKRCLGWLEVASRSTALMKDFAGQLEWRASHCEDKEEVATHLKNLVAAARNDIKQNDDKFRAETGNETHARRGAYGSKGAGRSTASAFRRPRASLMNNASASASSSRTGPVASSSKPAALHTRRSSVTQGVHRPTAASMRKARPSVLSTQNSRIAVFSPGRSPARVRPSRPSLAGPAPRPPVAFASTARLGAPATATTLDGQTSSSKAGMMEPPGAPPSSAVKGVRFQEAKEHDGKAAPVARAPSPVLSIASSFSDVSAEWEDVKAKDSSEPLARRVAVSAGPPKVAPPAAKPAGRRSLFGNNSIVPQAPSQRPAFKLSGLDGSNGALNEEDEEEEEEDEAAGQRLRPSRNSGNFFNNAVNAELGNEQPPAKRAGFSAPTAASRARRVETSAGGPFGASSSSLFGDENVALPSVSATAHRLRDQVAPYKLRDSEAGPARRGRGSLGSVGSKSAAADSSLLGGQGPAGGLLASVRGPSMPPPRTSMFPPASSGAPAGGTGGTSMFASGKVSSLVLPNGAAGGNVRSGRTSGGSTGSSSSSNASTVGVNAPGSSTSTSATLGPTKAYGPPSHTASRSRLSHAPTASGRTTPSAGMGEVGNAFGSLGRSSRMPPVPVPPSTAR